MAHKTLSEVLGVTPAPQERTRLSPKDEQRFRAWVKANRISDVDHPQSKYDYRGYWQKHGDRKMGQGEHFTDEFKQHGHETFSEESRYSRGPGDGGRWAMGDIFVPALAPSHKRTGQ